MSSGTIFKHFARGAKPTPKHLLMASPKFKANGTPPAQVIVVPPFLEMWLNDQYGDCVTAEEAFAKAFYSVMQGQPETKITDATVMTFCNKYDTLNGADLPTVLDAMASDGFQQDNTSYKDGPKQSVDYTNESILQAAIAQGPVKVAIDATALPQGAGNANGWYDFGGTPGEYPNTDHCVSICGYGTAAALFAALGAAVPPSFPTNGYFLYTWSTIGVVDFAWIQSTVVEAWLRTPTTPGVGPAPTPTPTPTPVPVPPVGTLVIGTSVDTQLMTITITPPTGYTVAGSTVTPEQFGLMAMVNAALNNVPPANQDNNWKSAKTKVALASTGSVKFNFLAVMLAAMKLFADVSSGNITAIPADIQALIASFSA